MSMRRFLTEILAALLGLGFGIGILAIVLIALVIVFSILGRFIH